MTEMEYIDEAIKYCLNRAESNIVIVPMGKWGVAAKEILNEKYHVEERFCIDNFKYDANKIFVINNMPGNYAECIYLLTVQSNDIQEVIIENLVQKGISKGQIIKVFSDRYYRQNMKDIYDKYGKLHLDFLCVGFQKCGTTSLYTALQDNKSIFLPNGKDTNFMRNFREPEAHEKLWKSYPMEQLRNKCVGGIESGYINYAKEIYDYFGEGIKILICVRNPVEALYSNFKMAMRDNYEQNLKKLGNMKSIPEMFDIWIKGGGKKEKFVYINFIKKYLKFYDKQQIKIIVLEELYSECGIKMREIQEFIGLGKKDIIEYHQMPHENSGSYMPRNLAGARINRSIGQLIKSSENVELKIDLLELRNDIYKITNVEYHDKMRNETYGWLLDYYMDSIHEMESFLDKSLNGIWY